MKVCKGLMATDGNTLKFTFKTTAYAQLEAGEQTLFYKESFILIPSPTPQETVMSSCEQNLIFLKRLTNDLYQRDVPEVTRPTGLQPPQFLSPDLA